MNELPVTLLSNACLSDFPQNTVNNFVNKVPKYHVFGGQQNPGNLQIALSECYVPRKYKNVMSTACQLLPTSGPLPFIIDFTVPAGHYDSPKDFVKAINKVVTEKFSGACSTDPRPVVFSIAARRGSKTKITFKAGYDVMLSRDIARVLGFEPGERIRHPTIVPGAIFSPFTATTHGGINQLYAYCSVAEPQVLADQMVNLLAILPWSPDNEGADPSQHIVVQNLQWIDIVRWDFDSIAVAIKDGSGQEVAFFGSNVVFACKIRQKTEASDSSSQWALTLSLRALLQGVCKLLQGSPRRN